MSAKKNKLNLEPQLHFLFGNVAVEKVLLHLYHHEVGNHHSIARDHGLGRGATARVLKRLVDSGLLKKESQGRNIWYSFDANSPLIKPILELIGVAYNVIPKVEKENTI